MWLEWKDSGHLWLKIISLYYLTLNLLMSLSTFRSSLTELTTFCNGSGSITPGPRSRSGCSEGAWTRSTRSCRSSFSRRFKSFKKKKPVSKTRYYHWNIIIIVFGVPLLSFFVHKIANFHVRGYFSHSVQYSGIVVTTYLLLSFCLD